MKRNSVVLLESNADVLKELNDAFAESKEFTVLYAGDDGNVGIKNILNLKPDLVLVGMFLKGTEGCSVMQAVKKTWPDAKIIATGNAHDEIIERALQHGASNYVVKPFSVANVLEIARDVLKSKYETNEIVPAKRKATTNEEKITEIFMAIGIPPHIKGYNYLREGIKLTVEKPTLINGVTKELYPAIAKKYDTSSSKVERAIRHAIEVAWNRGRIDAINAIFGSRIYLGTEKPTNSEFIALVADKLILENLI